VDLANEEQVTWDGSADQMLFDTSDSMVIHLFVHWFCLGGLEVLLDQIFYMDVV
jgi:hypothetical protein